MDIQDGRGAAALARAHGLFNIAGGMWPLLHVESFEKVFGPKTDRWLERTVAGLLVGIGWTQLRGASTPEGVEQARRIGMATAGTLLAIDLTYVPIGRIRPTYLLDAAAEALWLKAWRRPAVREAAAPAGGAGIVATTAALLAGCAAGAVLAARALDRRAGREPQARSTQAQYVRHVPAG
ncbi:hypothetical protein GCM10009530_60680 [Microbispora corallina]|uniref:Uncharacterized protein n=1 Tax=Microbispora corallina TaxID=83302 RepID=A0ABQ4FYZ7_9ACTN|nr:hypothetical protein [Microbispora corallina]GIH40054.1 hypothetical protein Mco01_30540 [Microbispora corallina]